MQKQTQWWSKENKENRGNKENKQNDYDEIDVEVNFWAQFGCMEKWDYLKICIGLIKSVRKECSIGVTIGGGIRKHVALSITGKWTIEILLLCMW